MKVTNFRQVVFIIGALFFGFSSVVHGQQNPEPDFKARLINLESTTKDPFRYDLTLKNTGQKTVVYSLSAQLPIGWSSSFKVGGSPVTALQVEPNQTQSISFEVTTPNVAEAKTYKIPVSAISSDDTLKVDLDAVLKGSYGVELTTPTGKLSDEVTEGSNKTIELVIKNTGTLPLNGLTLTSQAPSKWEVNFDLSTIEELKAGESKNIKAQVNVPNKTIAGDYMATFNVRNDQANAKAEFRITVETSILTGWLGIVIILLAVGLIYYLIRKYGRR